MNLMYNLGNKKWDKFSGHRRGQLGIANNARMVRRRYPVELK